MTDKYFSFDEKTKRFKPISLTCFFCNCSKNDESDGNFYFKLYKEHERSNYFVYRNVKFSSFEIGLPRCLSCKIIHDKVRWRK